jgi:pimeloyl-ACP methyl ester carboxylesterase
LRRIIPFLLALALLLPAASAFADTSYQTPNGPETISSMSEQLRAVGYGGPWDETSVIAAYARTTGGPVTLSASPQPSGPTPSSGRTMVVFVGGLASQIDSPVWNQLQTQLKTANGYRDADFVRFSYDSWSPDSASKSVVSHPYTIEQTCAPTKNSEDQLASMLRYLHDNHLADHVVLVGHSLGGVIAYDVAANHPELTPFIHSVVTVDSPLGGIGGLRASGADILYGPNNTCASADELYNREAASDQTQQWLGQSASALAARGVKLVVVNNPNDGFVTQEEQQVPATAGNANLSLSVSLPNTDSNHSAVLFDPTSVHELTKKIEI